METLDNHVFTHVEFGVVNWTNFPKNGLHREDFKSADFLSQGNGSTL